MGRGAALERDGDLGEGRGPSFVGEQERAGDGCAVAVMGRPGLIRGWVRSRKDEPNVRVGVNGVVCRRCSGWSVGRVERVERLERSWR